MVTWDRGHLDRKWPFHLEWLAEEWTSQHIWKRGAAVVVRRERPRFYLKWIRDASQATRNRIDAGDVLYAKEYARGAAHWAHKWLKGMK